MVAVSVRDGLRARNNRHRSVARRSSGESPIGGRRANSNRPLLSTLLAPSEFVQASVADAQVVGDLM